MHVRFVTTVIFFAIIAKKESFKFENSVFVVEQHRIRPACQVGIENTLQESEIKTIQIKMNLSGNLRRMSSSVKIPRWISVQSASSTKN